MTSKASDSEEAVGDLSASVKYVLDVKLFLACLVTAVVLGLVLRINYITGHFLWNDETATRFYMSLSWADYAEWFREGRDFHPPLFFAWLRAVLGTSFGLAQIQTLRYVDLVWLPASIGVIGWMGLRRPRFRPPAIVLSLLLAAGPTFVYLGAELRSYGLFTFLAITLTVLVIEHSGPEKITVGNVLLLALVALLLSFTHYTGLLVGGAILGAAVIASLIAHRRWMRFVVAEALALVGFITHLPAFLNQLDRDGAIYSTPVSEASGFVVRGLGPIGWSMLILAIVAAFYRITNARRQRDAGSLWRHDSAIVVSAVAIVLFLVGVGAVVLLRDVDLLNFGVSLVPAFLIVLGSASVAGHAFPRATVAAALLASLMSVTFTINTNRDPSIFEGNRISTVDVLHGAVEKDSSIGESFGSEVTIVHVDWGYPNDYFLEQAELLLPRAQIELLAIADYQDLESILEALTEESISRVLVITRLPLELRILPQIPMDLQSHVLNQNLVEIPKHPDVAIP